MKKTILLTLFAASMTLIPIICHQKVLGKSDFLIGDNNQKNIAVPSGFGYIQTRNGRIAINGNQRFTIYGNDGEVVMENMSLEQLKAENPDLYDMVKDSIASRTLMMDAGRSLNYLKN
ncbi:MAG: hypothetical protein AAF208_11905 [Cyanobacteria bacterium P01_A01_bin.45]